ncbi:MAG TPA: site-specific integrase [Aeromicrobium sp.]|nr:site-specific integrase [Aeromicrobium sp.]HKY59228.1 site-specific integrase [Aeromicrobium sp.]
MGRPIDPKVIPYKKEDGTYSYRVRVRVNGRGTTETFPNENAAKVFILRCKDPSIGPAKAVEMREREDTASPGYVPLVKELLVTHVQSRTGVEDRTREDYLAQARRSWLPFIGEYRVDEVERADIARWINATAGSKAPKTIENEHGVLSGMMETAIELGYVTRNPAKRMKLPRAGEEDIEDPKFLSHPEFDLFWPEFPDRWLPFVSWMFGTGTRFSETTAVQKRDLDLLAGRWEGDDWNSEPTVKIVRSWKAKPRRLGPPKSLASRRTIYLDNVVLSHAEPLLEGIKPDDFLFRTSTGQPVRHSNFFNRVWKPATLRATICPSHRPKGCRCLGGFPERCRVHTLKDANGFVVLPEACGCNGTLSFRPRIHDARHTHASWLIAEGIPLEVVQERLGHEDYLTTKRLYGHLLPHAAADAARAAAVSFARTSLGKRDQLVLPARPLLELA